LIFELTVFPFKVLNFPLKLFEGFIVINIDGLGLSFYFSELTLEVGILMFCLINLVLHFAEDKI
jgi:hypothetical protein